MTGWYSELLTWKKNCSYLMSVKKKYVFDMPPFVSPSQRCVGCTARMAACVSGPTPAPVLRAGWADSVRNVSIRKTFFTTHKLPYRQVFADLLASISCHPSTPFGTQREFRDSRNNKGLSVRSQTKQNCLF